MTDYERDIYSKIYDITEENLKPSGLDMAFAVNLDRDRFDVPMIIREL